MKRFILFLIMSLYMICSFSQKKGNKRPLDTLLFGKDSIVVFADKSWEYLRMLNFDGIMNPELHELAKKYGWKEDWKNTVPYTYDNDLSKMKDTLWLCSVGDSTGSFAMPHPGMVTSTFKYRGKRFHYGIDVDLVTGDTVVAAFDGIVRYAMYNKSGFGNLVIIRHYNGLETYYAHLDKLGVSPNQEIKAGEYIGLGGNTGKSYGDHLHFEVRLYGNALDPEEIIDFKRKKIKDENLLVHRGLFTYGKSYKSTPKKSSSSSNSSSKSNATVHIIKKGDSLYYIAIKYGTTVDKLCALNNIKKTDILHIGDKIKLK